MGEGSEREKKDRREFRIYGDNTHHHYQYSKELHVCIQMGVDVSPVLPFFTLSTSVVVYAVFCLLQAVEDRNPILFSK